MKKIVIAIDGHSSSGKSTMAKDLAKEIGYTYIDTGAMYRAVTLYCIQHGFFEGEKIKEEELKASIHDIDISFRLNAETGRPDTYLNGVNVEKEIRGMEVADKVSPVATLGFVRRALVAKQQETHRSGGQCCIGGICLPGCPSGASGITAKSGKDIQCDHGWP